MSRMSGVRGDQLGAAGGKRGDQNGRQERRRNGSTTAKVGYVITAMHATC